MRVLVTGTNTFFGTRLVQALGKCGADVTAADSVKISAGGSSRYSNKHLLLPRLGQNPQGYVQGLLRELRDERYDLLLPAFEEALLLSEFTEELNEWTNCLLPSWQNAMQLHDKAQLFSWCREHNISTPETVELNGPGDLERARDSLRFPVILKPAMGNNSVGKSVCETAEQLAPNYERLLRRSSSLRERFLAQEMVDGDLLCTLMLCRNGRKLGEVVYRTLRSFPDSGGTSAIRESVWNANIVRYTERLAERTEWSGFLGLDFLVDSESGKPYLIDANPRANPAVQLGFISGVNWIDLLFESLRGRTPKTVSARRGLRARSLMLDIAWLVEGFQPKQGCLSTAMNRIRRFLRPEWSLDSRSDLLIREDPLPTLCLAVHSALSTLKALATGQQVRKVILDDANYNAIAAAEFAQQRQASLVVNRRSRLQLQTAAANEA